ncbi:hypothetical protein LDA44_14990, partial [Enterococcus faecium]|nr:hypothetical protein [Enterococcus faecium]MCH3302532.1 hypothetical protein [Enterococcus faecium]MCH3305467.1 hypothetical protein [Enterococcus faecium]
MEKELSTLDQYLIDPDWGKPKIEETSGRKIRRNLLTNEELAWDQDDLGNHVTIWDHVYLIHLSKHSNKPEYIYVIEDGLIDALEEYDLELIKTFLLRNINLFLWMKLGLMYLS